MTTHSTSNRKAFTIVELMVVMIIMIIIVQAIGFTLTSSEAGSRDVYEKGNSEVTRDAYVVRRKFDAIIRPAVSTMTEGGMNDEWIEVKYRRDFNIDQCNRYAHLYYSDGRLCAEYGNLDQSGNKIPTTSEVICENVASCVFKREGKAVQMILTLDNGMKKITVASSASMNGV